MREGGGRVRRLVIVGAGTAGCVLAARLAEQPTCHVTLVEAGPDLRTAGTPDEISGLDALAALGLPDRLWPEVTVTRVPSGSPVPYVRGRGVGGSGVVNGMLATLGPASMYDEWARTGCTGWSAADLAPAVARLPLERRRAALDEIGDVDAALLASVEAAPDDGSAPSSGFDAAVAGSRLVPLTRTADGRRSSVVDTVLESARTRSGLVVRVGDAATHVLLDGRRVVGVALSSGDIVEADEVVVSAGAVHTPALLLSSGIGASGIGASGVGPAGVGLGVQDHPAVSFTLRLRRPARAGRLAMAAVASLASDGSSSPDLQLLAMNRVDGDGEYGALVLALLDVQSRGRVTLGADAARPRVDLAQLSDERDLVRLARGVLSTVRLIRSGAFDEVADAVFLDASGTPLDALGDTVDDVARWLTTGVQGLYHVSSSCRMGAVDAEHTVVDSHLKVLGVEGLRVCDASVFPRIPAANPHLPVALVAERAAELIASDQPTV